MSAWVDLSPMLLSERKRPLNDPEWFYEIKHDGYRILATIDGGKVRLRSKNGADATSWYPEVCAGLATLAGQHVIDGEACVLDDVGRSDFDRLHVRSRRRGWFAGCDPVVFMAFDLLVYRGKDIQAWPIERRKAALLKLLTPTPPSVLYVQHIGEGGERLFQAAVELKLEGIVAKRLGSVYQCGVRSSDWQKVKRPGAVPPGRFKR